MVNMLMRSARLVNRMLCQLIGQMQMDVSVLTTADGHLELVCLLHVLLLALHGIQACLPGLSAGG